MQSKSIIRFDTLIILVFVFIVLSCAKKTTPAPTPTPTPPTVPIYSFTAFGITANGVQYTISNPPAGPMVITGTFGISTDNNYQTVQITVNNAVNAPAAYTLNAPAGTTTNGIGVYTTGPVPGNFAYNTNTTHTGNINITKVDMVNSLMSASFSFVGLEYAPAVTGTVSVSGSFTNISF
jgi:hypothetical protein